VVDRSHRLLALLVALSCQACGGATERDRADGGSAAAGSGGTGGACNDLERVDIHPTCSAWETIPDAVGGSIPDGLYVLVGYSTPGCTFGSERTARISRLYDDVYALELVTDQLDGRASATFVTSGTTMTTEYTCAGPAEPEHLTYSVFEEAGGVELHVLGGQSALIFERFGD